MSARPAAALCALALLCGCVTVPEFRGLEREVARLKRGGAPASGSDARLADLGEEVARLRDEVSELRGEVEQARFAAEQALEEARSAAAVPTPPREAPAPAVGGSPLPAGSAPLTEEVRAYEEAFRLYRASDYGAAIDRFQAFLQNYETSDYADNALFWLGECHFKLGDYERAVLKFHDVVEQFPQGNKAPDALYRQGVALMEFGRRSGQEDTYQPAACQVFERLVDEYPESERVREARSQLEIRCK